jgi:hypothetical protein
MQAAAEASSSNQPMPPSKNDQIYSNISSKDQRNTRIELFPGAQLQNNEMLHLLKVMVMPKLNFFQAHSLPIRLLTS